MDKEIIEKVNNDIDVVTNESDEALRGIDNWIASWRRTS